MSDTVVLSVDGLPGLDGAANRDAHLVNPDAGQQGAIHGNGENGRNGVDAPAPLPGQPAGALAVELSESAIRTGGVRVSVLAQEASNQVPAVTEILPRGNVLFTAKGGDGEAGRRGGDGQAGMPGRAGRDATQHTEATAGGAGGTGGDAGRGSHGAPGGEGGNVTIYVDENRLHLLLAASWDVRGGLGGAEGLHGEPGVGGAGGAGGQRFVWEEHVDNRYRCTPNCIGRATTAMVLPTGGDPTMAMMRNVAAQMGQGSRIQTAVARIAQTYHEASNNTVGGGACRCHGGSGHCFGCEAIPIYRTQSRMKGDDGPNGRRGNPIEDMLLRGTAGADGRAQIIVRHSNGHRPRYDKCYDLQLVDFDLEDENGDGIFEPGECAIVRRMIVKNAGGMPSPSCQIPSTIIPSGALLSLANDDGRAFLPTSIPAGHSITSEDFAQVLLATPTISPRSRAPYTATEDVALRAVMPWLDRELTNFELRKKITIQYPLDLREAKRLASVAHGMKTEISWQVFNKSNISFGGRGLSVRQARVRVSLPSEDGSLLSSSGTWVSFVDLIVPGIHANTAAAMTQILRVAPNAQPYKTITINLALYISAAGSSPTADWDIAGMRFIQSHDVEMQVAPGHVFKDRADVLLVTNANTRRDQFEAIRDFIKDELSLTMDIWNVNLYGGLFEADKGEGNDDDRVNVLSLYHGKTIIFLGNKFDFYDLESTSVLNFCDAESVFEACVAGTSCLYLGAINDQEKFKNLLFPVLQRMSELIPLLPVTSRFEDASELIRSLTEQRSTNERSHQLGVRKRWYLTRALSISSTAKSLTNALQDHLPQERFWVCPVESVQPDRLGLIGTLLVHRGLPQCSYITATESSQFADLSRSLTLRLPGPLGRTATRVGRRKTKLDKYDEYSIVGALSMSQRVDILWCAGTQAETKAVREDLVHLIALSAQEDLVREIRSFLSRCSWPNSIDLKAKAGQALSTHLPGITALLEHPAAKSPDPAPPQIFHLLYFALAACKPQKKRHVAKQILLPFGHRGCQLHHVLAARFEEMLTRKGTEPKALRDFRKQADSLHSSFSSAKRKTSAVLAEDVSNATHKPTHFLSNGRVCMGDVYPRTRLWTEEEWNGHLRLMQGHEEELSKYMQRAWEQTERLVFKDEDDMGCVSQRDRFWGVTPSSMA